MTAAGASAEQIGIPGGVSRETTEKLLQHRELVRKWTRHINLVAQATLDDYHERHLLDSAQLFVLRPPAGKHWVDLGSGGGFPGLVVAIIAQEHAPELRFTLIESDQRKAAFLTTAARELGVEPQIIAERAEEAPCQGADIVSARALAPLDRLLPMVAPHLAQHGRALLPKGANADAELAAALEYWRFDLQKIQSTTNPHATLLSIGDLQRV